MSCSCTFSPAIVPAAVSPSRHVNFSTGMILGVEDYQQEFTYHSARDKWIMRALGGYGTISGLGVSDEVDGSSGPRIRVGAGSAVAPGGQLICVGADQCVTLNTWLGKADIKAKVDTISSAQATPAKARLKVWITLCYTCCAIAPVPIPGQPCRSEEDLMAPSRIADDYLLSLSFDPPPIGQAGFLRLLTMFMDTLTPDPAQLKTPAAIAALRDALRMQANLLFGKNPETLTGAVASISYNPDLKAVIVDELRNFWVTKLLPGLTGPDCGMGDRPGDDCLPLAALTFAAINPGGHWEVDTSGSAKVDIDFGDRAMLMSLALASSPLGIGAPNILPPAPPKMAILAATGTVPADINILLVRSGTLSTTVVATLEGAGAGKERRRLFVRNANTGAATLKAAAGGKIDGKDDRVLAAGETLLMFADGAGNWSTIGGGK